MILKKLYIKGFRNFKEVTVNFNEHSLLIGANDVGKTNLIYALRILLDRSFSDYDFELAESDFFASPLDERNIRRRYEDERNQSDVLRQSLVLLLVALEMLLGASLHTAVDVFRIPIIILVITLKHEESLIVSDDLRVYRIAGTPAKREVVDGIEKVGLTHAVMADKTVNFWRQLHVGALDVFIINNGNIL